MVPEAAVMVRVRVDEVSRSIEMVCASAGVKLVRVFPVVGVGTNHTTTEGGGRQAGDGVRGRVGNPVDVRDIQVKHANVRKPSNVTG